MAVYGRFSSFTKFVNLWIEVSNQEFDIMSRDSIYNFQQSFVEICSSFLSSSVSIVGACVWIMVTLACLVWKRAVIIGLLTGFKPNSHAQA